MVKSYIAPVIVGKRKSQKKKKPKKGQYFINWELKHIEQLGQISDKELAKIIGCSTAAVFQKRKKLNIPAFQPIHVWKDYEISLLGTMHDKELAKFMKTSSSVVTSKRLKLGIAPFYDVRHDWSPEELAWLGTQTDKKIAKLLNITFATVMYKRISLKIPAFYPKSHRYLKQHEWTEEQIKQLGIKPDSEIAQQLDLAEKTVAHLRRSLGIAPYNSLSPALKEQLVKSLGSESDAKLAEKLHVSPYRVRHARKKLQIPSHQESHQLQWRKKHIQLLGTMPDSTIAKQLGISVPAVQSKRKQLNITAFNAHLAKKIQVHEWTEQEIALLGTKPDQELAKELGKGTTAVGNKRRKLGIASYEEKQEEGTSFKKQLAEIQALLGKVSDNQIAEMYKVEVSRVAKLRKKQKIPSFRSQAVPVLTAEQIKLLGTVYDRELAAIVGCNINAITKIRMQMGIKAIGKKSN
jgi:DNA-binding CsgD family transcriptional regulator